MNFLLSIFLQESCCKTLEFLHFCEMMQGSASYSECKNLQSPLRPRVPLMLKVSQVPFNPQVLEVQARPSDIEADLENRSNGASPLKKIKTLTFVPSDLSVDRGLQQLMMRNQHKTMAVTIALTSPSF
jgi:hypothetical protein